MRTEIAQRLPDSETPERQSSLPALVLDALEMGAVALDRERRVVYANRRIEELLGVEPGALLNLPGNRVFPGADARMGSLLILSAGNWLYQWFHPDGPLSADEVADRFADMIIAGLQCMTSNA